jgi:hypothetical protein
VLESDQGDTIAMAMNAGEIESLILEDFPDAKVTIEDLRGDGDHYAAHVGIRWQNPCTAASNGIRVAKGSDGQRASCPGPANRRA